VATGTYRRLRPAPVSAGDARTAAVVPGLARPLGKYPHFRRAGDFIFVSGTSSRRPDDTIAGVTIAADGVATRDIRAQTRAVLEKIRAILATAGASLSDCVEITTYLVDMRDFAGYNEVYGEFFDETGPARTTIAVRELPHPHFAIEMRAVAYRTLPASP
jgi:2-aminomuconate deaminase